MLEKNNCQKKIYWMNYALIFVTTIIIFYVVNHFWNWNLNVPIDFSGDTITDGGTLTLAQKAIRGDGILSTASFWSVDGMDTAWGIMDGSIHYAMMCILALFIQTPAKLANIYYILTFPLCACFMYYALTRLKVNSFVAASIGIIYTFLYGHFRRGIAHLAIGSCFALPLMVLGCVYLLTDQMFSENENCEWIKFIQINKRKIKINMRLFESIVGVLLVGFSSIYFCVFAMIVHVLVGFLAAICNRNRKEGLFGALYLFMADCAAAFFTVLLPNIMAQGGAIEVQLNTRIRGNIDIYALKLSQLVLPIYGHRIPLFSKIRNLYYTGYGENENMTSSLGLILSIAFIVSLVIVFIEKTGRKKMLAIKQIGKVNLLILLIAMVGGGCEIIGLITYSIRSYNRMSFIIACFSCVVLAYLIDGLFYKMNIIGRFIFLLGMVFFAIFDQTNVGMKISKEMALSYENNWKIEEDFFKKIEDMESENANVLVYPSKYSSLYQPDVVYKYEPMKAYIHTNGIKFSVGYAEASATDFWIKALDGYTNENKLKIAVGAGLDGILLYKGGFIDGTIFEDTISSFNNILGEQSFVISENGEWIYYSLRQYKNILNAYDRERIKEGCLEIGSNIVLLDNEYQFGLNEIEPYLVNGFSRGETDFRWSIGDSSSMDFVVNAEKYGDLKVVLKCLHLNKPQSVQVRVNGVSIGEWELNEPGEFSFVVKRSMMRESNRINMQLIYSDAESLAIQGISADDRKVAVAWQSILIEDLGINVEPNLQYSDFSIFNGYLEAE